jgi:hypothetical protein
MKSSNRFLPLLVAAWVAAAADLDCSGAAFSGDLTGPSPTDGGATGRDAAGGSDGASSAGDGGADAGSLLGDAGNGMLGTGGDSGSALIGGTITGLSGTVVLQDNGKDDLRITRDGTFAFSQPLSWGAAYDVTVSSQPPGEACTVVNGQGTVMGSMTDIQLTCSPSSGSYTIGGTLYSPANSNIVLQNNGGDDVSLSQPGPFTFSQGLATGATYSVTILAQPQGPTCNVQNGTGTIASANVTNVSVICR